MPRTTNIADELEDENLTDAEDEDQEDEDETGDEDESEDQDDDEQDDDDESEGDDDDEKPRSKKRSASSSPDVKRLESKIDSLFSKVEGNKTGEKRVSKVQQMLGTLLKNGYKKDQVQALALIVDSLQEDIREEIKSETAGVARGSLDQQCRDEMDRALDTYLKEYPFAKKAREALVGDMIGLIDNGDEFKTAKSNYLNGRKPGRDDFEKAAAKVMRSYLRESGIKSKKSGARMSDQLDVKTSRSKPSGSRNSGSGGSDREIDARKLNDMERMFYVETLNATRSKQHPDGDKKLARDVLQTMRGVRSIV